MGDSGVEEEQRGFTSLSRVRASGRCLETQANWWIREAFPLDLLQTSQPEDPGQSHGVRPVIRDG